MNHDWQVETRRKHEVHEVFMDWQEHGGGYKQSRLVVGSFGFTAQTNHSWVRLEESKDLPSLAILAHSGGKNAADFETTAPNKPDVKTPSD